MARTRNLKHGFFRNEQLAGCDPLARLLWAGMWTIADREGRLEDRPKRIKADVLPYDNCDAGALLSQLAKGGFIIRYSVGNEAYIQITTWNKHQQCHVKETPSVIPPPTQHQLSTVQDSVNTETETVLKPLTALTLTNMLTALTLTNMLTADVLKPEGANAPSVADATEPDDFAVFFNAMWLPYPKKVHKQMAVKAARRVAKKDRANVVRAATHYAQSTQVLRGYIKDPEGWLNNGIWRDYVDGPIIEMEGDANGRGTQATSRTGNGTRTNGAGRYGALEESFREEVEYRESRRSDGANSTQQRGG